MFKFLLNSRYILKYYHILFLSFFIICVNDLSLAQQITDKKDTVKIYRHIEKFSERSKATKFIYKFLFRSVAPEAMPDNNNVEHKNYKQFENKIIRRIQVVTLNPFGNDLYDSSWKSSYITGKLLNDIHVRTLPVTVRNLLIFKKGEVFDSVLVKESERLVRKQSYIREVYFHPVVCGKNSDSVDIQIRVLDYWSIIPEAAASTKVIKLKLSDKNLAGLGHRFANSYSWNHSSGSSFFETSYTIPNFQNTYISSEMMYEKDEQNNYIAGINIDRPFYTPVARWAGGISFSMQQKKYTGYQNDSSGSILPTKFIIQDYWTAGSWQLKKGRSEDDRTTNLILSARYFSLNYLNRSNESAFPTVNHENTMYFLTGLGLSSRKYVQDNFIFNFGKTEDIPIGRAYGLVAGYQINNNRLFYLGANFSYGNYYSWGYLRNSLEYGTLFNSNTNQQGEFNGEINYNTKLLRIGAWNFRQFSKSSLTLGIKRLPDENLSLNDGYGINGFNSSGLEGTQRILFSMQTQSYAPGNILGFQFGPYMLISLGMMGNGSTGFRGSKVYSQFGIGALIRNKYLVTSTFQISFSFYPSIPGNGDDIFRFNSFRTNDFGFADFDLGRPGMLVYK
jgi:hypothetical protein